MLNRKLTVNHHTIGTKLWKAAEDHYDVRSNTGPEGTKEGCLWATKARLLNTPAILYP
jgi:hypothetical protein